MDTVDYGSVEIASECGWETYWRVSNAICKMLEGTGKFHGYSWNTWSDLIVYDEELIDCWLASDLTSMYYALQVTPGTQAKDDILGSLDDEFRELYHFGTDDAGVGAPCSLPEPEETSECMACRE